MNLLDGLQALARADAAALEQASLDLAELVGATVGKAAARHPDVAWTLKLPDRPVPLRGWEPGLRLVVDNLLENAARHGRGPRGAVRVTLEVAGDGADAALHVDDDGAGVPDEERERIFEPFVRVNGTAASGSGLGLALVTQQVDAHGATVEVERSPLGGARFTVRFGAAAGTPVGASQRRPAALASLDDSSRGVRGAPLE